MQPGIRCRKQSITPAPGVWDYDGRDMCGKTMSISVFQWVQSADGTEVKRGKAVRHFSAVSRKEAQLVDSAERLCQELELDPDVTHCSDPHVRIEVAADTTIAHHHIGTPDRTPLKAVPIEFLFYLLTLLPGVL
jgi:hypothetical protein